MASLLTSVQRYAAGTLFSIALNQAQIHQTSPLGYGDSDDITRISNGDSVSDHPELWINEASALLRPVFKFLEVEHMAWPGIEETALSSPFQYHVGAFMRLLSEETSIDSSTMEKELALTKAIDALTESMETTSSSYNAKKEMHREYEHECREKFSIGESHQDYKEASLELKANDINLSDRKREDGRNNIGSGGVDDTVEVESNISYPKKVVVLYELLSACLAESHGDSTKKVRQRNGFDARHRVALRILATWLDIKWKKVISLTQTISYSKS